MNFEHFLPISVAGSLIGCASNNLVSSDYSPAEQHCFEEGKEACELALAYCSDGIRENVSSIEYNCGSPELPEEAHSSMLDGWISAGCDEWYLYFAHYDSNLYDAFSTYCNTKRDDTG